MIDILKLCDDLANIHDCLLAARNDGGSDRLRDYGWHICDLNKAILDNVNTFEDVKTNYSKLGLVDLEFKSIQPGIEQELAAEAKRMYGAAYAKAQTLKANILDRLDTIVLQEKTLRDTLKTGAPAWAACSITNIVTGANYTLDETEHIRQLLSSNNRL